LILLGLLLIADGIYLLLYDQPVLPIFLD
jgi:hypothetical protein